MTLRALPCPALADWDRFDPGEGTPVRSLALARVQEETNVRWDRGKRSVKERARSRSSKLSETAVALDSRLKEPPASSDATSLVQ